jgi:hypothetical protein
MTTAAQSAIPAQFCVRTIVAGGVKLGLMTSVGVVAFALAPRATAGTAETIIQSLLVLAGGVVFSYGAAMWLQPRDVDSIAWTSLVGLLGALTFTLVDTVILRPFNVYHWSWDQIGGGSGFWYIPVWWMGATVLAWLGAWIYSAESTRGPVNPSVVAGKTVIGSVVLFVIAGVLRVGPFSSAMLALCFCLALAGQVLLAAVLNRK